MSNGELRRRVYDAFKVLCYDMELSEGERPPSRVEIHYARGVMQGFLCGVFFEPDRDRLVNWNGTPRAARKKKKGL